MGWQGGDVRLVGNKVNVMLDLIAAGLRVVQIVQLKKSCRRCGQMGQVAAPNPLIPNPFQATKHACTPRRIDETWWLSCLENGLIRF